MVTGLKITRREVKGAPYHFVRFEWSTPARPKIVLVSACRPFGHRCPCDVENIVAAVCIERDDCARHPDVRPA